MAHAHFETPCAASALLRITTANYGQKTPLVNGKTGTTKIICLLQVASQKVLSIKNGIRCSSFARNAIRQTVFMHLRCATASKTRSLDAFCMYQASFRRGSK